MTWLNGADDDLLQRELFLIFCWYPKRRRVWLNDSEGGWLRTVEGYACDGSFFKSNALQ
jgi:hypothetical protein